MLSPAQPRRLDEPRATLAERRLNRGEIATWCASRAWPGSCPAPRRTRAQPNRNGGRAERTADIERFWFRAVVAGEPAASDELAQTADAWQVAPEVPPEAVFDEYRQEGAFANALISATPLDAPPAWWPEDRCGAWRRHSLRDVIRHVMTETACHAGQLDAARELIDGRPWRVLNE